MKNLSAVTTLLFSKCSTREIIAGLIISSITCASIPHLLDGRWTQAGILAGAAALISLAVIGSRLRDKYDANY